MPRVCLQFVIFPDYTHLLFLHDKNKVFSTFFKAINLERPPFKKEKIYLVVCDLSNEGNELAALYFENTKVKTGKGVTNQLSTTFVYVYILFK